MIPVSTRSTSLTTGSCSISTSRTIPKPSPVKRCWVRVLWRMLHHESPDQKVWGLVVDGTGLEQHGTAAGGATNTPVGCLLVRGSQRIGMSTKKNAVRPFGLGTFFVVSGTGREPERAKAGYHHECSILPFAILNRVWYTRLSSTDLHLED